MNGAESGLAQLLQVLGTLLAGAALKFIFDRVSVQMGWSREEKRDQDGKIQRVDSHARSELTRIERELGGRLGTVEKDVGVLSERVENLPTADDMQELNRRLGEVDRGLGSVVSKVDGVNGTVKTILDHILAGERRA